MSYDQLDKSNVDLFYVYKITGGPLYRKFNFESVVFCLSVKCQPN